MERANPVTVDSTDTIPVTFKLFAMLTDHLPPAHRSGNQMALHLPRGTTVQQVVEQFNLPRELVHLVLVNGKYIAADHRAAHVLQADDALAIWPPIAGG